MNKSESFGHHSFFTGQYTQLKIICKTYTKFLTIKRSDFLDLLDEFPEDYEKFCFIKDTILDCKDYAILGIKCKVK
jgi:hypothetical protein